MQCDLVICRKPEEAVGVSGTVPVPSAKLVRSWGQDRLVIITELKL